MIKFQLRIFIARPEGKDGIEKPKVKLLETDSKRIGKGSGGDRLEMGMNGGRHTHTHTHWSLGLMVVVVGLSKEACFKIVLMCISSEVF